MEQQPPSAQTPPPVQANYNIYLIAENHKALMQAVLLMLLAILCRFGVNAVPPETALVIVIASLVIHLLGMVRAIIAVAKIKSSMGDSTVSIVLCAIGLILPCISLIILLVINSNVVGIMKSQGVNVGLMGISDEDLEALKHRSS